MRSLLVALLFTLCGCATPKRSTPTSTTLVDAPLGRLRVILSPSLPADVRARINQAIETSIKSEDFVAGVSFVLSVELDSDPTFLRPNYRIHATLRDGHTAELCASSEESCVLCNAAVLAEQLTRTARRLILEAEFGKPGKAAPDVYPPDAGQGTAWN